ncbi:MAG: S8 family serine peptidase [Thermoplasmata archaeon]|nr:S8 family serine peptidase [Candidatus Sysuiplasma jiujiangense]
MRMMEFFRLFIVITASILVVTSSFSYILGTFAGGRPLDQQTALSRLINGPFVSSGSTELPMLGHAHEIGQAPSSMPMYVTVSFNLRDTVELSAVISEQQTPGSPMYHHYLTLNGFEKSFGPAPQIYNETELYFRSMGLVPVPTGTTTTLAFLSTASAVSSAFRTHMDLYKLSNGTVVYANSGPLYLPAPIAGSIASVNGITSIVKVHTDIVRAPLAYSISSSAGQNSTAADSVSFASMSDAVNFSSPGYLYTNSSFPLGQWQFLNPSTMTRAYGARALYSAGDMGQGSTIAVVMAGGYNPADIANYSRMVFGNSSQIPGRLTAYPVAGATGNASSPGSSLLTSAGAFEFSLDIEYSSTMAPKAHIDAVYGPSLSTASLVSAYAKLTTLSPVPNVITNSWGGSEDIWWNLYGPSWQSARALENYFMELTSMGATILSSSGDSGGYDSLSGLLSVSFPASSPYVVAVGGVGTAVGNMTGIQFPASPQYVVNQTVAPYGYSEINSYPVWFPDYPLNGSSAGNAISESYWYTPSSSGQPDYASGGTGLSYWFLQPWWQHGIGVPDSGRRMVPDISAEANFNETVYFDGAWNFFWGGTSFASPTVAGEIALLDTYLNMTIGPTTGRTGFYLGLAQPLLYRIGNDPYLPYAPYTQIGPAGNLWDQYAISKNFGWPGGQNWTSDFQGAGKNWNPLDGWGVPEASNLAFDAELLLNSKSTSDRLAAELNGQPLTVLQGGRNYNLTLINTTTGSTVAGATVNLTFTGSGGITESSLVTTGVRGNFSFNATSKHGYLSLYSNATGIGSGFQFLWISRPNLTSGQLTVSVVGESSVMGGFDFFNGFMDSASPALGSLMPNTVAVRVMYRAGPSSPDLPVYNALVTASSPYDPVSSPPFYANANYTSYGALNYTQKRSLSFTNISGIAYVETWNVLSNENYTVSASYLGLSNSTVLTVTPHFDIQTLNAFSSMYSTLYGGLKGYVGSGANSTMMAPSVASPGVSYPLFVRVTYWNGTAAAFVHVDIAVPNLVSPPFSPVSIAGTQTTTDAFGIAELTVNYQISSLAQPYGILLIQAFNSSYSSEYVTTAAGSIPFLTNDSNAALLLVQGVTGAVLTGIRLSSGAVLSTSYIGTKNALGALYVSTPVVSPFMRYNNITNLSYRIDNRSQVSVPLPATGQESFYWSFPLDGLPAGEHNLTVDFNDSFGFSYSVYGVFYVIGNGTDPAPDVSFVSPSSGSYVSGQTTIDFSVTQSHYLLSELLAVNQFTYDVMGLRAFTFNASSFGYGPLSITLTAVNYNGASSQRSITLYAAPHLVPSAHITSPSEGERFNSTGSVTVGLSFSGEYLSGETLQITGPSGKLLFNVTGKYSLTVGKLSSGTYHLLYTVKSSDGSNATSSVAFVIVSTPSQTAASNLTAVSPLAGVIAALTFIAGVLIGLFFEKSRRGRHPPRP